MRLLLPFAAASTLALAVPAQAAVLYFNDFDAPAAVAAGVTAVGLTNGSLGTATSGSWNAAGWSGNFFKNGSMGNPAAISTLTLTGLAPNSAVKISGIVGLLNSWDSTNGGGNAPDFLDFFFNGSKVASLTSNTGSGSIVDLKGATQIAYGAQVDNDFYFSDTLGNLSTASFVNGAADATGKFVLGIGASGAGWQGGTDESWGIDSLKVDGTVGRDSAVPEPATWAMMIAGFAGVGGLMRRQRRAEQPNYA